MPTNTPIKGKPQQKEWAINVNMIPEKNDFFNVMLDVLLQILRNWRLLSNPDNLCIYYFWNPIDFDPLNLFEVGRF
jgi:hypothetical protein